MMTFSFKKIVKKGSENSQNWLEIVNELDIAGSNKFKL